MLNHSASTTLLHATLKNQHAITDALSILADWVAHPSGHEGCDVAERVRGSLRSIEENRALIGLSINELMRGAH